MLYQLSYASAFVTASGGEGRSGYSAIVETPSRTITIKRITQIVGGNLTHKT
jgi:hypothetical protein